MFALLEFTPVTRQFINPAQFRATLPPFFRSGYDQHDCSEFAKIVLDKLEQETKSQENLTSKYFEGKLESFVTCNMC
jgi:ubiquitin C-terminal hydrolase